MKNSRKWVKLGVFCLILSLFIGCSTIKGFLEDVTVTLGYKQSSSTTSQDTTNATVSVDSTQTEGGE